MTDYTMGICAIVLSALGLCISALIILYLLKQKVQSQKKIEIGSITGNLNKGLVQWLRQIDISFKTIVDTINKQRDVFCELIKTGESKMELDPILTKPLDQTPADQTPADQTLENRPGKKIKAMDEDENFTRQYAKVTKLADSGLSVDDISRRVKIPRGEIELILKFRRLSQRSNPKRQKKVKTLS